MARISILFFLAASTLGAHQANSQNTQKPELPPEEAASVWSAMQIIIPMTDTGLLSSFNSLMSDINQTHHPNVPLVVSGLSDIQWRPGLYTDAWNVDNMIPLLEILIEVTPRSREIMEYLESSMQDGDEEYQKGVLTAFSTYTNVPVLMSKRGEGSLKSLHAMMPRLAATQPPSLESWSKPALNAWLDATTQYQRRSDLVSNIINTIKTSTSNFDQATLNRVTTARAQAAAIYLSVDDLTDPAKMQTFHEAQSSLGSALGRLLAVSEHYPQLSETGFRDLRTQLEGTENRIAAARQGYNDKVSAYNQYIGRGIIEANKLTPIIIHEGERSVPTVQF